MWKTYHGICGNLKEHPKKPGHFLLPPLIGLKNIGGITCMNAILQCFCHIEKFVQFFKCNHQIIEIVKKDKSKLTSSFKLLIEKLWPEDPTSIKYYAPEEFKNKILKMSPVFKGIGANEPKNLLNFIVMTLHEELNKKNNKEINNKINDNNLEQTNQKIMFKKYFENFINQNASIISDLFFGTNCSITRCCKCITIKYNYETYFIIVFPLEEVKNYKYNLIYNQFSNFNIFINDNLIKEVTLYDCFEYKQKINLMSGVNAMYCNNCKGYFDCSIRDLLTTGPEILILRFNRKKGNGLTNVKIEFSEDLNLCNYIQYNNTGFLYNLIGVTSYIDGNDMKGNFIAYCKDPVNCLWYKYNDDKVTQVTNFKNEILNYGIPYVLFYQKLSI